MGKLMLQAYICSGISSPSVETLNWSWRSWPTMGRCPTPRGPPVHTHVRHLASVLVNKDTGALSLLLSLPHHSHSLSLSHSLCLPRPATASTSPMAAILPRWRPSPPELRAAKASPSLPPSSVLFSRGRRATLCCRRQSSRHGVCMRLWQCRH
jgi:hypothetical protein